MRKFTVAYTLTAVALMAVASHGCKKRLNGIDNNQIISKPYSIYFADSSGKIDFTNNGTSYTQAFGPQGSQARAMAYAGNNFIVVYNNAFVAEGKELELGDNYNLNPINQPASTNAAWQSMILRVPNHDGRIYLAANAGRGVIYSDSNGKRLSWVTDTHFNPAVTGGVAISSFTQLANGELYGFDHTNKRLFKRTAKLNTWDEVTTGGLPANGKFFLSHINTILVLGDSSGASGVWYSTNNGVTWAAYSGLPATAKIMCMQAPFDRALLVGTASDGMFRLDLNSTAFTAYNAGLTSPINIRAIASKDDYYKNEEIIEYVYLATDQGIYRSKDIGRTWTRVRIGNFVAAY